MNTVAYRCPACGAPLEYDAQSGKLRCTACENAYALDLLETRNEEQREIQFERSASTFDAQDAAQMQAYTCPSCGAELMTDETTTATQCPYCGSPTILPERIEGGVRPEWVIPFSVTQEQAQAQFSAYFKGKKLLPRVFETTRNRIDRMRKLYVPYWLFDCSVTGRAVYDAQKKRVRREGDWEITETDTYVVCRGGSMDFKGIPVDGSAKLDDKITESLEPYDMSAAVPFASAVLAGAMADRADVDCADCEERARDRVKNSMEQALRSTVSGYTSVTTRNKSFYTTDSTVTPVLMPVWLMTTVKEGKTYTFAVNGQTGKLVCDVPADGKKTWLWAGGVFAGVMAAACAALYLAEMLESGMVCMAAILALIAAAVVVGVLMGQLKQAESAHSAGNYAVNGSFDLVARRDDFVNTTTTRRMIEQKADGKPAEKKE